MRLSRDEKDYASHIGMCIAWYDGEQSAMYRLAYESANEPTAKELIKEINDILKTGMPLAIRDKPELLKLKAYAQAQLKKEKMFKLLHEAANIAIDLGIPWWQYHGYVTDRSEGFSAR